MSVKPETKKQSIVEAHVISDLSYNLALQINHQMSASNDELLFNAAKRGDLKEVKELLSKGTGTGYQDEVI